MTRWGALLWGGLALVVIVVGCGGNDRAPTSPSPPTVTQPTLKDVSGCYRVEQEGEWMLASVSFALTNTCDVRVKSSFLYVVWVNESISNAVIVRRP